MSDIKLPSSSITTPATAIDSTIVRFDGTTGKIIQDSGITIDDSDNMYGFNTLTADTGFITGQVLGLPPAIAGSGHNVEIVGSNAAGGGGNGSGGSALLVGGDGNGSGSGGAAQIQGGIGRAGGSIYLIPGTGSVSDGTVLVNSKISNYNAIDTAGWGVPAIYGKGRSTGQTGAVATVATYTCGTADGSFYVSGNINVTTYVAGTITAACDYTDETNTARTLTFTFSSLTGTLLSSIGATGPFEGLPFHIRCKASTTITIKTTVSLANFTYNVEGIITQIA